MKKLIQLLAVLTLCIALASMTLAAPATSEPATEPATGAAVTEGESAEGESDAESADAESAEGESAEGESADAAVADGESADAAAAGGESAEGESDGESAEGESGDSEGADASMAMANGQNNEDTSVLVIIDGEVAQTNDAYGTLEMAEGGLIDETTISGVKITGTTDESNGIFVKAAENGVFTTIGGEEDYFDVEGIGSFNTVIDVYGKTDADPQTESTYGTVITLNGGDTIIDNVYGYTKGYRAGDLYTMSSTLDTNVIVKDSVLWDDGAEDSWFPDAKLFPGSARATLLQATNLWLYNTGVVTKDWGAISQDGFGLGGATNLYAVNTASEAYSGGYTLFAHDNTNNYLYGSRCVGAEFGVYVFCAGNLTTDNLDAADEAALEFAEDVDFSETVTEDGNTLIAGGINAIVVNSMAMSNNPSTITLRNTTLSTEEEDLTSVFGTEMFFDLDSYLTDPDNYAEPWFYLANVDGAAITARSHATHINIEEGTEIKSASGVLLQTSLETDEGGGDLFHDSGDTDVPDAYVLNINAPVEGDILHEDYQRDCEVNVASEYTGCAVTGSITAWNDLWSMEGLAALLEEFEMTEEFDLTDEAVENIRSILVREEDTEAYTEVFGILMNVEEDGVWNVEGESSVISLTVADGAEINASEIYVDCEFGEDGYLDASTGTQVDELEAGEYSNVVLVG